MRVQLILVFLTIILVTVTSVTVLMYSQTSRLLRVNALEDHHRLIHQTVSSINSAANGIENAYLYFNSSQVFVSGYKDEDIGRSIDTYEKVRRLKELMFSMVIHTDGVDTVIFITQSGQIISNLGGQIYPGFFQPDNYSVNRTIKAIYENPATPIWYINDVVENGEIYYLRSVMDPNSGEVLGILAFIIDESLFSNRIADLKLPGGDVFISDQYGNAFIHSSPERLQNEEALPVSVTLDRLPVTSENRDIIRITYPTGNSWFVSSEIPKATLYRDIQQILLWSIGISAFCILFSLTLAVFVSRRYTKDLSVLVTAMDTSSEGNLETISNKGSTIEFRSLASTYNTMIHSLDRLTRDLKNEIVEKTYAEAALRELNETLELKVTDRTYRLSESLETLRLTQSHLIESEKMVSLGSLVAAVAHEINTPVGIAITGSSYLVDSVRKIKGLIIEEEACIGEDLLEFLDSVDALSNSIYRMMTRVADLVSNFKQVSVDQTSENRRDFYVGEYFNSILSSLKPGLGSMTVEIDCPTELTIDSFPGVFGQILTNLVMNSKKHGFSENEGGNCLIYVRGVENRLVIEYSDNGRGMDESIREKVFEPFFTTDRGEGTGLGMHIVYNLVTQKLGGRIECLDSPGKGVRFIIIIPRHLDSRIDSD